MRRRFRFSPSGGAPHDPWFRIGTLDVNTTVFVTILSVVGLIGSALVGFGSPLTRALILNPDAIVHGQVWRLITWPFAYTDGGGFLWAALTIAIFWYFGRDLEDQLLGRTRMAQLVVGFTLAFSLVSVALYAGFGAPAFVWDAGLATVELMVLLAWVAEWPQRRFLFNIPAWVFGLVIVLLTVLQYIGSRSWAYLVYLLVGMALCAVIARSLGMLAEHHVVPKVALPHRHPKQKKRKSKRKHSGPTVVAGPWQGQVPTESPDEARMNALLEKIHAEGQDALSAKEKAELLEIRDRLRRRP